MRIKITKDEQAKILSLMTTYQNLHSGFSQIEVCIKEMEATLLAAYKQKEELDEKITAARSDEDVIIGEMVQKYGHGKLSLEDMEWIINTKKTEHDRHIEEPSKKGV